MSLGLQLLDQLAEDILNGRPSASLQGTVEALPAPPDIAPSSGSSSVSTTSSSKQSKSPSKKSSKSPKSPARGKRKASSDDPAPQAFTKKVCTVSKPKKPHIPSNEFGHLLDVNQAAPAPVRCAIAAVLAKAEALGKKPWRLAFPWTGRPIWYDPIKFCHVYRAHRRFWMTHRRAFWEWDLHAPLATAAAMTQRQRYDATLANALDPSTIDTYGYPDLRSLLESSDALNPAADEKNRLSIASLDRVRRDTMSCTRPSTTWAGDKNKEPWMSLINSHTVKLAQDDIMAQLAAGTYKVPTTRPPSSMERHRDDWSELGDECEDEENEAVVDDDDASGNDDEESEADDDEDEQEE
ncbi:uncharacterized protein PITG_15498 [Phytophthora infestans T30-4]|uniref:Uncharacterized protein n=1 Tax=Phytophthora infestans (strain T30-4) TaxID=403677 RepID=D0NRE0_PHYIT|nr:uncharacterized protein PITG_15498 [Phytophthora infestans T30-4]EEY63262.1 conserved hypothetical protein [Phytophthora infestans T30-4]|eukprot:XP_002898439.1 conserved hypothetical protein [Phytophthora infestans T30-4]